VPDQTVKAANHLITAGNIQLVAEAIVLLEAQGVDVEAAIRALSGALVAQGHGDLDNGAPLRPVEQSSGRGHSAART
jgi:2-hydroxy-3-oxopropionate reductase